MSSGPPNAARQSPFLSGFVALALVTLGFVIYVSKGALFTYEARREVAVLTPAGTPLLDVNAAATRVEQTAFDARLVERLAATTQRSIEAATTDALEVRFGVGNPGHVEIICRDGDPQRADAICDEIGRTAVNATPGALTTDKPSDPSATRLAALRELARFTQAHPALATAAPSAQPPEEVATWQRLWKAARDVAPPTSEASPAPTVRAELVSPTLGPQALGGGPSSVLITGFLSALGVGLVIFGLQRGKRARPAADVDESDWGRGRQSLSSRPPPRLTSSAPPAKLSSSAPPPKPTSSAPPPKPTSSAPPPKPTSSAPPPNPTSSAPPPNPTSSAPPPKPTSSAPPAKPSSSAPPPKPTSSAPLAKPSSSAPPPAAKASPLPPRASPLADQSPATERGYAPPSPSTGAVRLAPTAAQISPPPPTADATTEAQGEKAPSTILPPREASAPVEPNAPTAKRTASGQVRYEATSLPSTPLAPVVPATRTTQMLGSIRPPSEVPAPISNYPETPAGSVPPRSLSRYSFVSTPPPAGGDPVRPHDLGQDWQPDPVVDPAPCKPLCRELFAFGVEHCFVIGVTSLAGVDEQKAEFASSLALALAASGHARVLLIEGDLDRPTQHRLMRAEMPAGTTLSRQLQARMTRRDVGHWSVLRASRSLHLLLDGSESTPGLILSRTFEECVRALRAYYDFIVLDGPPGSRESACCALDGVIDGLVILCTEERRSEVPQVSRFFTSKRFSKAIRATT